ncbi:MAG: hypothetical protein LQ342_001861 [Letrouitia transgressa]|nr:MAG: hypothetical protein LQ342_001861 [Letrouitia transgressa]
MPFTTPSPPLSQTQNPPPPHEERDRGPEPYTYRLLPTWKPHRLPSGRIEYAEAGTTWRRIPLPLPPAETETEDLKACLRRIHRTSRAWQARWWRANGWMFAYEKDATGQGTRHRRGAIAGVGRDEVGGGIGGAGGNEKRAEKEKEKEDEGEEKRAEKEEKEDEAEEKREIEAAGALMQLKGYRIDGRRRSVSGGDGDGDGDGDDEGREKKMKRGKKGMRGRRRSSGGVSPKSERAW